MRLDVEDDPLKWWRVHRETVEMKYLCVPASQQLVQYLKDYLVDPAELLLCQGLRLNLTKLKCSFSFQKI